MQACPIAISKTILASNFLRSRYEIIIFRKLQSKLPIYCLVDLYKNRPLKIKYNFYHNFPLSTFKVEFLIEKFPSQVFLSHGFNPYTWLLTSFTMLNMKA